MVECQYFHSFTLCCYNLFCIKSLMRNIKGSRKHSDYAVQKQSPRYTFIFIRVLSLWGGATTSVCNYLLFLIYSMDGLPWWSLIVQNASLFSCLKWLGITLNISASLNILTLLWIKKIARKETIHVTSNWHTRGTFYRISMTFYNLLFCFSVTPWKKV